MPAPPDGHATAVRPDGPTRTAAPESETKRVKVEGTVVDDTGEPLIGATVYEKETANGTTTDINGHFTLSVPKGAQLTVHYLGYAEKSVPSKDNGPVDIRLDKDTQMLDNVVVVGYGTQKKVNMSGAVDQLTAKDLEIQHPRQGEVPAGRVAQPVEQHVVRAHQAQEAQLLQPRRAVRRQAVGQGPQHRQYIIDGKLQQTVSSPALVSPNYTWEKVRTANAGIDLGLLANRLTLSFDIYRRDTRGMLTKGKEMPGLLGAAEPNENAADMKTTGWELSVAYRDQTRLAGKPLSWGARFVLSDNRSWITRFDNPDRKLGQYYKGMEIGEIWGLTNDGFFRSADEIAQLDETQIIPWGALSIVEGWPKYKDIDGDHAITKGTTVDHPGDLSRIGNSSPRYRFGLNLTAEWNGFDLSAFVQGIAKRDYYPLSYLYWSFYQQPYAGGQKHAFDFYRPADDSPEEMAKHSKSYIAAGLASKNITLGYTLPSKLTQRMHVSRIRVYASADNLFETSALKKYFDPEAVTNSDSYGYVYPFNRQYAVGVNVTF